MSCNKFLQQQIANAQLRSTEERFDDSVFTGYLTGAEDYFKHDRCFGAMCGTDLRDNMNPANYTGVYSTHLFAQKAAEAVNNHNTDKVLKVQSFSKRSMSGIDCIRESKNRKSL